MPSAFAVDAAAGRGQLARTSFARAPEPRGAGLRRRWHGGRRARHSRELLSLAGHRPDVLESFIIEMAERTQIQLQVVPHMFFSQTVLVQRSRSARFRLENARRSLRSSLCNLGRTLISAVPCSGPPFHSAVFPARVRTASITPRARTSSNSASAAARARLNTFPASDCANIRASTAIFLRRVLSRFTGIESPCFNAFRLERALPAEVFGPRPSKPLRRLAAICLSVAILRFPQWF
jgi:hypothetical protein